MLLIELIIRSIGGFFSFRNVVNRTKSKTLRKFYRNIYLFYLHQNSSYIGLNTVFLNQPCFPHGINGIFISDDTVIGKNCVIFPNVVIGSNHFPDSRGLGDPHIGDNCFIGAGATIVGNVKIDDNCRIGANATVFKDVPSNSVVVSMEPRIIPRVSLDNKFYTIRNKIWTYYQDEKFNPVTDREIIEKLNSIRRNKIE